MLPNRWLKDHVQTAENCQKFICETSCSLYEYIANDCKKGIPLSTLGIPTALENFIYAKSIRKIP